MSRDSAQLFIGRLSKATRQRDLENVFGDYGRMLRCDLKFGKLNFIFSMFDVLRHKMIMMVMLCKNKLAHELAAKI